MIDLTVPDINKIRQTQNVASKFRQLCDAAEIGLLMLSAFDSPIDALDHARFEYITKRDFDAAERCLAWRDTIIAGGPTDD